MNTGSRIADLRAGHQRRAVVEPGGARRAAGTLGDILVNFAVLVRAGAEPFDRSVDQARVKFVNYFPGKTLTVERTGREILHHHVAGFDQLAKNFFAFFMFRVDRDTALVAVEHGEIQTIDVGLVAQLAARNIAAPRQLDFDPVGAEPGEYLRAGRPRLHVGHV